MTGWMGYEISTHFNLRGRQCVMEQFKELILSEKLIYMKVDIYFTAAGMIDIPTEQEILAMMKEIRENPQDFRFVA